MSVADLEVEAARFASVLSDVRNGSVCRDVELETVIIAPDRSRDRDRIAVGHRLSEHATPSPIPLSVAESAAEREGAPTWLTLDYKLMLDEHLHHLSVHSSSVGLCIWPNTGRTVIRSEFDRDKDRYPTAHTHVAGTSLELGYAWGALARKPPRGLDDLHFPVGGLRFRPSLEDFIEFLIRFGKGSSPPSTPPGRSTSTRVAQPNRVVIATRNADSRVAPTTRLDAYRVLLTTRLRE
jgi:hypothetical protein